MLNWLFVCIALLTSPLPEQKVTVYLSGQSIRPLSLPAGQLEKVVDLAFDEERKTLYVLGNTAEGYELTGWKPDGSTVQQWKVPQELQPVSTLFAQNGVLKTLGRNETEKQDCKIIFRAAPQPEVSINTLEILPLEYDAALDREGQTLVHHLMKKARFIPTLLQLEGGTISTGLFDQYRDQLIDGYKVNTSMFDKAASPKLSQVL